MQKLILLLTIITIGLCFSCSESEEDEPFKLGDTGPGGGLIFYLDGNGGGLEASLSDQSTDVEWGCSGTNITAANGTSVGSGTDNTEAIVASCSETNIAARICSDLVLNGYDDWFLPSKDEFLLMDENLASKGLGDFANEYYWTSTNTSETTAASYYISISGGALDGDPKTAPSHVRAVRAF